MIRLRPRPEAAGPDITPLLDVVFILLVFFIVAAAFAVHGMDLDLPASSFARTYAGRPLEIVLAADGSLLCDEAPTDLRELGFTLRRLNAPGNGPRRQILLKASARATVEAFMQTVDVIRRSGGEHLVIATEPARPGLAAAP